MYLIKSFDYFRKRVFFKFIKISQLQYKYKCYKIKINDRTINRELIDKLCTQQDIYNKRIRAIIRFQQNRIQQGHSQDSF